MTKFLINGGPTYSGKGSITLNITPNPKNDRTSVNEGVLKISYGNNKTKEVSLKQLASGTSSKKIFRLRFINYTETEITWNCAKDANGNPTGESTTMGFPIECYSVRLDTSGNEVPNTKTAEELISIEGIGSRSSENWINHRITQQPNATNGYVGVLIISVAANNELNKVREATIIIQPEYSNTIQPIDLTPERKSKKLVIHVHQVSNNVITTVNTTSSKVNTIVQSKEK